MLPPLLLVNIIQPVQSYFKSIFHNKVTRKAILCLQGYHTLYSMSVLILTLIFLRKIPQLPSPIPCLKNVHRLPFFKVFIRRIKRKTFSFFQLFLPLTSLNLSQCSASNGEMSFCWQSTTLFLNPPKPALLVGSIMLKLKFLLSSSPPTYFSGIANHPLP